MLHTTKLESFSPNQNPYCHDFYHMGCRIGPNVTIMMPNHEAEVCPYLIIINTETGERLQVEFKSA